MFNQINKHSYIIGFASFFSLDRLMVFRRETVEQKILFTREPRGDPTT